MSIIETIKQKIIRSLKFYFVIKPTKKNATGHVSLCSNIEHEFHLSIFEAETCKILSKHIANKNILTPEQHKYQTKFDFIIKNDLGELLGIIEPHGIWYYENFSNNKFLNYYIQRRKLANLHLELKALPIVVLANMDDLNVLENEMKKNTSIKQAIHAASKK